MRFFRILSVFSLLMAALSTTAATYDASTRFLTLSDTQIGADHYSDIVIRIDSMDVLSVGTTGRGTAADVAVFNPTTSNLTLGPVTVQPDITGRGATTYAGAVVRLNAFTLLQLADQVVVPGYRACSAPANLDAALQAFSNAVDDKPAFTLDDAMAYWKCDPNPTKTFPSVQADDPPGTVVYYFDGLGLTLYVNASGAITGMAW